MENLYQGLLQSPYGLWIALGLLFTVFIGSILLVVNIIYLAHKRTLTSAAIRVGGTVVYNFLDGPYLRLKHHDIEYRMQIKSGSKNNLPSLVIEKMKPLPFILCLLAKNSPQNALYQFCCQGRKVTTQNSSLEEQLIVKSDSPSQAESFLQSTRIRDAIKFLLENGYERIIARKNKIMIKKRGYSDDDFKPETINKIIDNLNSLSL